MVSELSWLLKGNGVNTAFIQLIELLKEQHDIRVVTNGHGKGDVYHAHSYGLFYFLRGLRYKGKRILTVHVIPDSARGSVPGWKLIKPVLKWYFRQVYSYADVCIALSPMVEQAIKDTGADTRIIKIYNPIPIDYWHKTEKRRKKGRQMLGLSPKDFVVLGVGQIEGRKGVEDFLDIAEALPEIRFVWAGGRPFGLLTEGLVRIKARIAKAPKNVSFPGMFELDDMPLIYAAADLFVFPSFQENCPMAPLEAAAAGLPVVFRDLREYQLLYENPYLKAGSRTEFINLIRQLKSDPEFYQTGVDISEKLLQQFNREHIRKKVVELYKELRN